MTGAMVTAPRVGSSSVSCETPGGVITSTAFGTVPGSTELDPTLGPVTIQPVIVPGGCARRVRGAC